MLADRLRRIDRETARSLLRQVGDDDALPATDAFKVGALVRLASIEQQAGDRPAASAAYAKSGVSAKQCALIDGGPQLRRVGSLQNFPLEAMRWGFEGWTSIQFDVTAGGHVVNTRPVIAYPPFVFSQAGEKTAQSARYEQTYRPDGELGCGGESLRVRFQMP